MFFKEPIFEPIARILRFAEGGRYLDGSRPIIIVDLGCGPEILFYKYAQKKNLMIKKYFGIDPLLSKAVLQRYRHDETVTLNNSQLEKKIFLPSLCVDYVVSFATLEHFDYPKELLNDAIRILKKHGKVILTTPSPWSKGILELCEKIGLISSREIHEHKNYFDEKSLRLLVRNNNVKITYRSFEMGLNNLLVIEKLSNR